MNAKLFLIFILIVCLLEKPIINSIIAAVLLSYCYGLEMMPLFSDHMIYCTPLKLEPLCLFIIHCYSQIFDFYFLQHYIRFKMFSFSCKWSVRHAPMSYYLKSSLNDASMGLFNFFLTNLDYISLLYILGKLCLPQKVFSRVHS